MRKLWAAAVVAGVGVVVLAGAWGWKAWRADWARRNPDAARIARYEQVFDAAWQAVDKNYYDPKFDHARWRKVRDVYRPHVRAATNDAALYINILDHMMRQVGTSHVSVSMPAPIVSAAPSAVQSSSKSGPTPKIGGCGSAYLTGDYGFDFVEVRREHGSTLRVADVRRGSNAERAGVAPDDLIRDLEIRWRKDDCPHAKVKLQASGQSPREVAFSVDDRLPARPMQRVDLPSGVRVLRFDRFEKDGVDWLRANLPGASAAGLVIDLRHNGGGKISVERRVVSLLLPPGAVSGQVTYKGRTKLEKAVEVDRRFDGPLVVLIGPATASAAEVTATALRHHRRALLIGGETAGAVLMSLNYPLPDGGRVQVAIADYLTPDGRRLEGVGVKPDLPVAQTLEAIRAGRDLPLEAAERALLEGRWRP